MMQAIRMGHTERRKRMRNLRKRVSENDVAHWSRTFLSALRMSGETDASGGDHNPLGELEWTVERAPQS